MGKCGNIKISFAGDNRVPLLGSSLVLSSSEKNFSSDSSGETAEWIHEAPVKPFLILIGKGSIEFYKIKIFKINGDKKRISIQVIYYNSSLWFLRNLVLK